jgi:hypothetical protein
LTQLLYIVWGEEDFFKNRGKINDFQLDMKGILTTLSEKSIYWQIGGRKFEVFTFGISYLEKKSKG